MSVAQALAKEIARTHAPMLAGKALTYEQSVQASDVNLDETTAGLFQGCRMLGFLDHDAVCIVHAWHAQSQRTGRFSIGTWPTHPADFGLEIKPSANAFPDCPQKLGLYAVLPDAAWVKRMAESGVPTLQLRFKSADALAIREEVRAAVKAVRNTNSLLFINDHWQIAIEEGAYGVHLGQEDLDTAPIDLLQANGLRLGLSTHGYAEMLRAERLQPSYIALGAVFPTTLKRMQTPPQGLGRLKAYAALMHHRPLVAIGGIDADRMPEVLRCGVGSIAVVRAITSAANPESSVRELLAFFNTQQS